MGFAINKYGGIMFTLSLNKFKDLQHAFRLHFNKFAQQPIKLSFIDEQLALSLGLKSYSSLMVQLKANNITINLEQINFEVLLARHIRHPSLIATALPYGELYLKFLGVDNLKCASQLYFKLLMFQCNETLSNQIKYQLKFQIDTYKCFCDSIILESDNLFLYGPLLYDEIKGVVECLCIHDKELLSNIFSGIHSLNYKKEQFDEKQLAVLFSRYADSFKACRPRHLMSSMLEWANMFFISHSKNRRIKSDPLALLIISSNEDFVAFSCMEGKGELRVYLQYKMVIFIFDQQFRFVQVSDEWWMNKSQNNINQFHNELSNLAEGKLNRQYSKEALDSLDTILNSIEFHYVKPANKEPLTPNQNPNFLMKE